MKLPVVWVVPPLRGGTTYTTQVDSLLEISLEIPDEVSQP